MKSIRSIVGLAFALAALSLGAAGAANAEPQGWFVTETHQGLECTHHHYDSSIAGPFASKDACDAVLTPTYGPICEGGPGGNAIQTEYPNLVVYLYGEEDGLTAGACPPKGAAPVAPPQADGSFLCYGNGDAPLYAADQATADADQAAGNWLPEAVLGNLPDGPNVENVGAYHLVCNAPVPGVDDGLINADNGYSYADDNGAVLDATNANSTVDKNGFNDGVYAIVG